MYKLIAVRGNYETFKKTRNSSTENNCEALGYLLASCSPDNATRDKESIDKLYDKHND